MMKSPHRALTHLPVQANHIGIAIVEMMKSPHRALTHKEYYHIEPENRRRNDEKPA